MSEKESTIENNEDVSVDIVENNDMEGIESVSAGNDIGGRGDGVDKGAEIDDGVTDDKSSQVLYNGFEEFGLKSELLRAIQDSGFEQPSDVQSECLAQAMQGEDLLCQARSGMGKTAVFVLSTLQQLECDNKNVSVLVICPTSMLAFQVSKDFESFSKYLNKVEVAVFFGARDIAEDKTCLKEKQPTVVVGTPGRILALVKTKSLDLSTIKHFIMDECDKLVDRLSSRADVQEILKQTPKRKQMMMFTATLSKETKDCCRKFLKQPVEVCVEEESSLGINNIRHYHLQVSQKEKNRKLFHLLNTLDFNQTMIFVKKIDRCEALCELLLQQNFLATALHKAMSQKQRVQRYQEFKDGEKSVLVATGLCGRGLQIDNVNVVFNYDVPEDAVAYLHRTARTGRFGKKGVAITMIADDNDTELLNTVQNTYKFSIDELPDKFDLSHDSDHE